VPRRKDEFDWAGVAAGLIAGAIGVGAAYYLLTKKCPNCGHRVAKDLANCSYCGFAF
jgi:hypothetical protein